jgi:hypothetical protein
MFGSMGQTNVKNLGNGGTMDGDVTITGDLTVSGGISLSLNEVLQGTSTIDINSTEALLVRKDGDGGDVFIVDTTNSRVGVGIAPSHELTVNNQIGIKRNGTNAFGTLTFDSSGLVLDQSASGYSPLKIKSNGSEVARFTSTGLGIGVTSNSVPLHIVANSATEQLRVESSSSTSTKIYLRNDDTGNSGDALIRFGVNAQDWSIGCDNSASDAFVIASSALLETDPHLTIATDGKVFLNQDNNVIALEIDTEATTADGLLFNTPKQTTGYVLNTGSANSLTTGGIAYFRSNASTTDTRNLVSIINDHTSATGTTPLFVKNDSSGYAFEMRGASGQIGKITNGSNNLVMYVDNSNVQIANNTSLSGAEKINMSTANEAIEFYTDGTERMRIDSSGNVNIGITSGDGKVHIHSGSAGSVTAGTSGNDLVVENSGDAGISILSPDANSSRVQFGSASDNDIGHIGGFYNSGDEYLFFNVGGSERMRIKSGGDVSFTGWIEGNNNNALFSNSSTGLLLQAPTTTEKIFFRDHIGTAGMTYDASNKRLGIGTDSPSQLLHIQGTAGLSLLESTGANQNAEFQFKTTARLFGIGQNIGTTGKFEIFDRTVGTTRLVVDGSGNVGIGTISPNTLLTVSSGTSGDVVPILSLQGHRTSNNPYAKISFWHGTDEDTAFIMAHRAQLSNDSSADITFNTANNGTNAEVMRVTHDNKVGIGTASPAYTLAVEKSVTGDWLSRIYNTATSGNPSGLLVRVDDPDSTGILFGANANGTYRFIVKPDGNVGIGISPVASQKLHVNVASNVNFTTSANSSSLRLNAVNDVVDATIPLEINSTNTQFLSSSVGIGTSPSANLHILNSSGAGHLILETTSASHGVMLDLRGSADRDAEIIFREGSNAKAIIFNDASNNSLSLSDGSGGLSPVLNIKTGSVGIGCDHPSVPLEVELSGDTGTYFEGGGSGNGTSDARHLTIAASTTTNAGDTHTLNAESATGVLKFATTGTNRMILDSNSRISLSNNDGGAGNTVFGELAGNALASGGNYNLLIGKEAGNDLTTSDHNVAIGFQALSKATANLDGNTAVGNYAMGSVVSNDVNNCTAIGYASMSVGVLEAGASGTVAVGFGTLDNLTSGDGNVAIGYLSGNSMTTGARNVVIGYQAGDAMTIATRSVAIGYGALGTEDVGDRSIAIGFNSLFSQNSDSNNETTGNVGIGVEAGFYNQTGQYNTLIGTGAGLGASGQSNNNNTALGYSALNVVTTGSHNVVIGRSSGDAVTDGSYNVFMGYYAGSTTTSAQRTVAIGSEALETGNHDQDGTVAIGSKALQRLTTGVGNVAIGLEANGNVTTSSWNTVIGYKALSSGTASANNNTAIGFEAGRYLGDDGTSNHSSFNTIIGRKAMGGGNTSDATLNTAHLNIAIGHHAVGGSTGTGTALTATHNTAIGYASMSIIENGVENSSLGFGALQSITSGTDNTAIGYNSGNAITTSQYNTLVGNNSGSLITTGWNSVMIGYATGDAIVDSHKHTLVGAGAGGNADITTDGAVAVGYTALADVTVGTCVGVGFEAGKDNSTGGNNVFVGYKAGHSGSGDVTDGQANVIIGSEATANASGAINRIAIGRTATAVADNSVTLGNANVTAVYMAQDAGATVYGAKPQWADSSKKYYKIVGSKSLTAGSATDFIVSGHSHNYTIQVWCDSTNKGMMSTKILQAVYGSASQTDLHETQFGAGTDDITFTYVNSGGTHNYMYTVTASSVNCTMYYIIEGFGSQTLTVL